MLPMREGEGVATRLTLPIGQCGARWSLGPMRKGKNVRAFGTHRKPPPCADTAHVSPDPKPTDLQRRNAPAGASTSTQSRAPTSGASPPSWTRRSLWYVVPHPTPVASQRGRVCEAKGGAVELDIAHIVAIVVALAQQRVGAQANRRHECLRTVVRTCAKRIDTSVNNGIK